jgi:hypothetical protein
MTVPSIPLSILGGRVFAIRSAYEDDAARWMFVWGGAL